MPQTAKSLSNFKKKEIDEIFASFRTRLKNSGLEIILAPKKLEFARILVITPRATANSPKRNQIRRRLKAIFYEEKLFNLPNDCIVIVRRQAINLDFVILKKILVSTVIKYSTPLNIKQ